MPIPIRALTGVYHADGGLVGEVAYLVGKLRGTAHCGLCDVTHHRLGTRPRWRALVADLGVPFHLVHLNERDTAVRAVTDGRTPCVLAHTDTGLVYLLGPHDLDPLDGQVDRFAAALHQAAADADLTWPGPPPGTRRP